MKFPSTIFAPTIFPDGGLALRWLLMLQLLLSVILSMYEFTVMHCSVPVFCYNDQLYTIISLLVWAYDVLTNN